MVLLWTLGFMAFSQAATTYYWDVNGSSTGATSHPDGSASGTWSLTGPPANFTTDAAGTSSTVAYLTDDNDVIFSAGSNAIGASTVTLGDGGVRGFATRSLTLNQGTLTFDSSGLTNSYFVFRGTTNALTLGANAQGGATFNADIVLASAFPNQTFTNANSTAGRDLIFNGKIRVSGNTPTQATLTLSNTSAGGMIFNGQLGTNDNGVGNRVTNLTVHNTGTGITTLNAVNPYTGSTQVTAGTLVIGGSGSINQTSGVQINGATSVFRYVSSVALTRTVTFGVNGGTFLYNSAAKYTGSSLSADTGDTIGGSGVLGNVTIASGGTLTPGALGNGGSGNLTVDSLTLQSGSNTRFDIDSAMAFDSITSAGSKALDGALLLSFGSLLADGGNLALFGGAGALSGNFASIAAAGAYSGAFALQGGFYELVSGGQTLTFNHTTGMLSVQAIPEPGVVTLLAVGVVLLCRRGRWQSPFG